MSKTKRILLSFALLLYGVFFGEVFLRLFSPVPMLPRYVKSTPYGIRGNSENKTYRHKTAEYNIEIRTNSKGIRSYNEIPYEKPASTKRIVLLGDSFAMGYGVNLEDTFSQRMLEYLRAELDTPLELINLATSGHGNGEELIVLREEGLKYEPDLVLLSWHPTDLDDNIRSGLFAIDNGELVQTSQEYLPAMKTRERLMNIPGYEFLIAHSQVYTLVREEAAKVIKRLLVSSPKKSAEKTKAAPTAPTWTKEDLSLAILNEIYEECETRNANFLVLDVPERLSRTSFQSRFPKSNTELPYPVFSPLSSFSNVEGNPKLYWEKSHGHFTPLGCDLVGQGLAKTILSEGLLGD
ncbi:SGNH/GDSL hydrolase family protein [Pelagicoccus sp. SDUM812003]|uniref:SGNH/GDSL hydrolase family protein n=1 Tax=Pelagicoccus sp. SDUM812003 TaxID=3041267 RepID=UPI00280D51E5|nr:SGNH/GDSL hydrolase family protein [Pelagicoccus sp. SDUM812003]MDQ8205002.1 SGNH/GDSL hydrolase family protein [Pelagicoccus sp. SDUM812003]